jgi:hypothetical protein
MRIFTITLLFFIVSSVANAQEDFLIKNFTVKENLLQNNKMAIIATDSLDQPQESVNGTYSFTINGFKQLLRFNNGAAVSDMEIGESAFIYIKHENEANDPSKMYYVIKSDTGLNPVKINWYVLLAIPIGLILLGYMFRKLIGLIVFILLAYIYFNYSKGLSFPTFLESIFDGLKNLF